MKKYLVVALIIIAGLSLWAYRAFASSVGPNSCSSAANDTSVGSVSWTGLTNACGEDALDAAVCLGGATPYKDYSVKLVKAGSVVGSDKATNTNLTTTLTYVSYGGSADLWGTTWAYSDINSSTFGLAYSGGDPGVSASYYLKTTGFGFSIPSGTTINGIQAEVKAAYTNSCPNVGTVQVDNVRITVTYTTSSGTVQSQVRSGNIKVTSGNVIYK